MVNRHITDWRAASPRGSDKTEYVILDTGEKMTSVASIEANKTASIVESGTVTINPSTGYDSMAKASLTVSFKLKAYVYNDGSDDHFLYTFNEAKTQALDASFSKVTVTYESTTDTLLYSSNTYSRSSANDISL